MAVTGLQYRVNVKQGWSARADHSYGHQQWLHHPSPAVGSLPAAVTTLEAPAAEPRHRAWHISTDFLPSMAEYNQILSQPQSCRKRSFSLLAAPIFIFFFLNSPSFEKQAKAIFASAPHIPLMSEMTSVLTRRYFYI